MKRILVLVVSVLIPVAGLAGDQGLIRVVGDGSQRSFRPDGTALENTDVVTPRGHLSPDGKLRAFISSDGKEAMLVSDADGGDARQITPAAITAGQFAWSPDSKRLVFLARPYAALGTFQAAEWQLHTIDADGKNLKPLAHSPDGAEQPRFAKDGRLAYLRNYPRTEKLPRADLVVGEGEEAKAIVKNTFINELAWSPDGKSIAYSTYGELVIHNLTTDKEQRVEFTSIDGRLKGHSAWYLAFSPDSQRVACAIMFLGDRQQGGPKMFGDDELFIVPREGKATWFQPGMAVRGVEWLAK
jgi:Tol biopolymer transport system component